MIDQDCALTPIFIPRSPVSIEYKVAPQNLRESIRTRISRMLVAVLVGTLFLPVGSLGITPLIEQAQASTAISTEAQLLAIQNNLSANYTLTASFSLSTTSNASYIAGDFTGTLNGAGFAISGLSKPLFNQIGNGTSSNGVTDLRLITYRTGVTGGGVLANTLESNSQISRVYVSGTLTGSGLAVGGLIGEAKVNSTVTNSFAAVNVTVNSSASTGGLIGVGRGSVTTSAASGNVTQSNSGDNKTGGLVGMLFGSLTNCFARGTVTSSAPYSTGGLVGRADGSNGRSFVTKSLAIGNVVIIGGGGYSGGLVGSTYIATIQNSYATGNVTTGTANGKLIGELKENSSVISSYATGTGPSLLIGATAGAANTVTSSPPAGTDLAVLNEVISGSTAAWGISSGVNGSTPYILALETSGFYTNINCSGGGSFTVMTGTKIKSGDGASCKGVVTIPEGITELEGAAFSTGGAMANANSFITEIRFPSTLTNTGDYGLGRLTGLTSLIVPGGAKIGIGSFNGLTSLTELTINGGTLSRPTRTDYTTTQGVNAGKSSGFAPQRLILGNGYTNIRAEAFAGSGFTEVIFGSGTYYVGTANFVTAASLQAIDFGTSTSPAITLATQNVTLAAANPYGLDETGQNAFQGSSIRSVRNCDINPNSAFNLRLKAITNDLSQTLYSLGTCNNTPPVITNTNPVSASGGAAPASVTITGTNFVGLVGVRGVMFGSTPATSYTVNSATSITAVPPAAVTSSVYSVTVNTFAGSSTTSIGSSDSSLSALTPSVGSLSPEFNKEILSYTANIPKTLNLSLTPTVGQAGATTVQYLGETGTTVFTGALNLGTNVIRTVVTSQDGQSTTVYRVTVPNARTPEKAICFNGNAQFLSLTTNSNLPLGNSAYTIEAFVKTSVGNQGGITEWGNVGSDQQVNGFALGAFVTPNVGYRAYFWGSNLNVNSRNNVLTNGAWHHVVSQWDGTTRRIYEDGYLVSQDTPAAANVTNFSTFVIGRGWNNNYLNGCLSNLRIVKGKAVYSGTSTTTPNFSVPNSTLNPTQSASTNINAITDTQTVLLMANTDDILLDNSSFRYSLTLNGTPTISSDGPFDRSSDSTLSALALSSGSLSPSFTSATEIYTASVANSVTSITVTPTRTQANATITVNGASVTSGSASGAISLNVGPNIITIVVTAQDGTTTKSYTVTVTRNSNVATLSSLTLSSGSLSPLFASATETYTASVANSTSSITVTPTRTQANATITVNGASVTSGSASSAISLNVGPNIITVVVTAQDGTTKTYAFTVTRLSNLAIFDTFNLSQLTPSVTGSVDNTLNTVQLTVPVGTNVTNLVTTFTFSAGASVTVGGTAQVSGTTANNFTTPVTYVVTSQDSATVRSYSVSVSFASNPSAPQNLNATGGQGSVSLSWSAPASNGGRAVSGYVIESSLDSSNWTSAGSTNESTTSLNISSLSNGTTYYFRVRATNASGSSSFNYSTVRSATTFYYVICSGGGSFHVSSQTIPSRAGQNCKGTATIPQGITGVATNAFAPNTSASGTNRDLTAIVFPATGFADIGLGGFMNLGLTTVTIPASVTTVGQYGFQNNPLTSATITGGSGGASTTLKDSVFGNASVEYGLSTQIALTFGSGKIDVADNFGSSTKFSTVDFGSALNSIAVNAFKKNSIVAGWIPVFPSTITSISSGAFTENPRMRTIRFGSETTTSLTSINEFAFDKNYLKSVQYCGPQGNANALSRYLRDYQTNAKIWCDFLTPNTPTISSSSQTNQQVSIGWTKGADRNEPLTDTFTVQYKAGSGSWITLSFETETPLSLTVYGLTNGTTYTFRVAANNIAGASSYSSEVQVTPLGLGLMPTFDTSTATADGFTFNVTNYNANYTWSGAITAGSGTVTLGTPSGVILPVTVSGMGSGATSSIRINSTRITYDTGTATTAGTALNAALTPTFGTAYVTTNGYTVPITNYDSNYIWSVNSSSGTAQIISGSVRVTGAAFTASVTASVTATRSSYVTGSANFVATTLAALTATYTGNGNTGGSVPSDTTSYKTNETFTVLGNTGTLIKPGYSFAGWKDNLGIDYQPGATYSLANAGVTFTAQWTANPYRVLYNLTEATSGAVPTDSNIYAIANTANVRGNPGNLQRTGYVFAGWADNANRTGRIYVSGDTYTVATSDINFWAAWTPNTYSITYDVNGANGAPSKNSDSYTVGSAVARLALVGTMAKSGYNFGGWATQAVGTVISDSFTVAANTKLFAQWTIASFTLTYNLDGGTGTVPSPTGVNYLQQFNLAPSTGFTKTIGIDTYAFVAWSANSATYNPGQSYFMPAADLTFTATWTRIYNVTYSFSGGSVANAIADQQKIALDTITVTSTVPTRTGYNFVGWIDQSGETATAGATYTVRDNHYLFFAQWQAISYLVTYDAASGSPAPSETAKTIGQSFAVGAAPTREFYTFNGWFDGTNTYFPGATYLTVSSNIVFTAQWIAKVFTVSYDLNGGAGSAGGNYSHTYGTAAYQLPTTGFARTDYNFGGWATSPVGTSVGATFAPSSDISLYAIWNIAIYRLTFDGQSGVSESATAKVTISQALTLPNATRANHTLQGWSTQQSGGSITAGGTNFTPASDGTLYAQWALQVFTVTYNPNGGTSTTPTASFTYGSTTPLVLPRPTRANYVFDNWYSAAVGGYLIGAADSNFTPTGSVTIYAHWIQASLEGLGQATKIAEVTVLTGSSSSFSAGSQGSTASVEYTADSLPNGTVITAYVQTTSNRASSLIDANYNYVLSIVVAWVAPDGTVPDTAVGKPIVVTITNSQITKGSRIYKLVGTDVRVLGTATEDGRVQTLLTQDPLVTVAITEPDSPTAISSVAIDGTSATVSWQAPEVTGGSAITEYVATSNAGQSCTTITTTCTITGLSAGSSYTFAVVARNVIGTSTQSARSASITTAAPPVVPTENTNNSNNSSDAALAAAAAVAQANAAAATKAAEEKAAAEAKAVAELKAAEAKAAAELKAAEEKAAAELKAVDEKAAAELKAAEEKAAAEAKATADAAAAAALAAKKITPEVSLYSISPKLTLSTYDLAYLKKYLSTLKKTATVTCIGYTYTQKTTLAKATVLAKQQANAVCSIVKKLRPTLKTSILIRPAKLAPKAAVGAKWVAISYRVDGFQPKK